MPTPDPSVLNIVKSLYRFGQRSLRAVKFMFLNNGKIKRGPVRELYNTSTYFNELKCSYLKPGICNRNVLGFILKTVTSATLYKTNWVIFMPISWQQQHKSKNNSFEKQYSESYELESRWLQEVHFRNMRRSSTKTSRQGAKTICRRHCTEIVAPLSVLLTTKTSDKTQ